MIFRRPKSYTITLTRAHSLLNIPNNSTTTSIGSGEAIASANHGGVAIPSRDQIQEAFRRAAKRHHPDLAKSSSKSKCNSNKEYDAKKMFRECHDARELLLDYYVRRKFVHPAIVESTKDHPIKWEENELSLFSIWNSSRSFQMEVFLRLAACLGLAVGTYYHDKAVPEIRRRQIQRRDEQFSQFGPQPRF
mmetsp:Transcript_27527/g.58153  ORF Transcript_27527/g.58153 Transcript_27527/m.58153 type:complete len:191 (+) Transcript_27527:185-757(+)